MQRVLSRIAHHEHFLTAVFGTVPICGRTSAPENPWRTQFLNDLERDQTVLDEPGCVTEVLADVNSLFTNDDLRDEFCSIGFDEIRPR
eukprot:445741-Pyramimonas_sp.AAC.1